MSIDSDTEWLRGQLSQYSFHEAHDQKWIAVKDEKIVCENATRTGLEEWLNANDSDQLCVLAFADTRILV